MKNLIIAACLLLCSSCFAAPLDSTFQRHQISLSMANGFSQQFFSHHKQAPTNTVPLNPVGLYGHYLPAYAGHIQLQYSVGISRLVRIEMGIGYLLDCNLVKDYSIAGPSSFTDLKTFRYEGAFTVPLHVKFTKPMPRGAFTCTVGPDFMIPFHSFDYTKAGYFDDQKSPASHGHGLYNSSVITNNSSMGFYLKMAYEKKLKDSHPLSISVGPVVDFFRLVSFHHLYTYSDYYGYKTYQFYAGLDVALNFGLKSKK